MRDGQRWPRQVAKECSHARSRDKAAGQLQHLARYRQGQAHIGHHGIALGSRFGQSSYDRGRGGEQRLPGQQDWQAPMIGLGARRADGEEGGQAATKVEQDADGGFACSRG